MARVNRRFLVASPLIALPIVLLMASLSSGTAPIDGSAEVQYAVPNLTEQESAEPAIRQVAGNQIVQRNTRPGLLEVIAGSRTTGSPNHRHKNMSNNQSRGLLDSLFGSGNSSSSSSQSNLGSTRSRNRSSGPQQGPAEQKESVNWEGIPYHRPTNSNVTQQRIPVVDPNSTSVAKQSKATRSPSTRIIRGGSSTSIKARTASTRTESSPDVARENGASLTLPRPPADVAPTPVVSRRISSTSSSRRNDRRDLQALEALIERKPESTTGKTETRPEDEQEVALIPRVAKNQAKDSNPIESASEDSQQPSQSDAVAATTSNATNAAAESAQPISEPAPATALAEIGKPTPAPEPATAAEPRSAAEASLDIEEQKLSASGNYTVPVDPSSTSVILSDIPGHPYAASTPAGSTPAAAVSHRAGPPSSAFQSPSYAGSPIGSGVVPHADATTYGQSSEPSYQTARLPGSASDPYGSHSQSPRNRLTTNGQPLTEFSESSQAASARNTTAAESMALRGREVATVPIYPIPGRPQAAHPQANHQHQISPGNDDFDRSTYETRNQMRGAVASINGDGSVAASELPGIRVITHGPSEIMIRQTSQFEIRVENRGSIDAEGVLIRAMVPDWADLGGQNASIGNIEVRDQGSGRLLVWTIDQLPAGNSERMFVRLTAARSGNYDLDVDWTLLPQKSVTKIQVHEPRLDVTIEGPDEVVYGQSQTYKVHILNPGDGTAPNVVFTLSPNSATPQTQRIGDIPAGKEAQFDVELTAQDLGDLKIHGLATAELELRAEAAKTIRVAAARLEAMLNGPELKYQNSEAVYNLQVQNTGSVASNKILATLRLPAGVEYVGGIDEATPQANVLRWEITSLPPGAMRDYQFACNLISTGEHQFAFDCKGTAAGQTNVSIATKVESIADLVLTVNDPPAPAPIGTEVSYEIVIRNRGSKEATDVRAVAQFSHGIEPQRIEGQSGEVVTGQVLFDPIARIGAGQEVRLRVIARAERAGHHRFRSEVRSGDTVLVAEEATHYMSPRGERVSRHSSDPQNR